ncbi:hypothetical protein [Chamaesiphon sp. VAR_69_metabat_338]|uniref:hypothetical protein n=1 Tax=Chamaesiphon sp. VAR_69_metabat_338 TaxID=2964704 RepID=UPI00286E2F0C|nr:hypothetical protein [Chamaesiphon sp. VAR_69_metabat_338]
MQKILAVAIAISLSTDIQMAALADTYDDFMKTQIAEFQSNRGEEFKCKQRKIEAIVNNQKVAYKLCLLGGKPIELNVYLDDTLTSSSSYRKGKLVHLALSEFGDGVGFRNGQPMVEWHYGEYGKRGVNWKIAAKDKAIYLQNAAEDKRILLKFGLR